jgi:two-component system, cell cycle response regulator
MSTVLDESGAASRLKNVLVVDNDSVIRKYLSKFFTKAGLKVDTANDGVTALDMLETYTPDLMIIDLVMPNIDGQTLCRVIRRRPEFKNTPIIILSAIAAEEATDMVKIGANICIAKVGFADMAAMFKKILDNPDLLSDPNLKNRVLGVDDLSPRNITSELLTINQHYRIVLDSISNAIISINPNNRIIYANPSALHYFSMPMEMILGKPLSLIFPGTTIDQVLSLMEEQSSKDTDPGNRITISVNNRILDLCIATTDVKKEFRIIIMEDITERENTRKALVQANNKFQTQAMIDGLTNVSNRRHFDELLHQEWGRLRREKDQLSLMICDVDYFKDYNDTYGHLKGDQCLRDIAETIKTTLQRPSDNVARYGGDEFVVLLPGTSIQGALQLADQIRKRINQLRIKHEASPIADHVTVTIGAGSGYPNDALPEDKFIWLADKSLYEAKAKGRNCAIGEKWQQSE